MRPPAPPENRARARTLPRATRPLLRADFPAGAGHFRARLRFVGALAAAGELPDDGPVDEVRPDGRVEEAAGEARYVDGRH